MNVREELEKIIDKNGTHIDGAGYIHKGTIVNSKKLAQAILDAGFVRLDDVRKDDVFIRHIKGHLKNDEVVICKICGKSADEIIAESKGILRVKEAKDD